MPTFQGKDGKPRFSMNPQIGAALSSGTAPGMPPEDDGQLDDGTEDEHVELHHGGHPEGQPPPHEGTQYHTIHIQPPPAPPDIRNHDDYAGADEHMQECMGEGLEDNGDSDESSEDNGGDSGDE